MTNTAKGRGQTALVTGASMGIGVDLAECFAKDGYDVVLAARSADALKTVAETLAARHSVTVTPIVADLGERGSGEALAADIAARQIAIDVVVNNAGYGVAAAFAAGDLPGQLGMIDVNIRALVELTHVYWPRMLANRRGGVLNVASTAAFQPGLLMAVYYASKAFVLSFSEALWKEAEGTGVHVSCLCPGPTVSHFRERAGTGKTQLASAMSAMPSAEVAAMGYQAWRNNQRVIVTGTRNAIMARLAPFVPRRTLLASVYRLQSPIVK